MSRSCVPEQPGTSEDQEGATMSLDATRSAIAGTFLHASKRHSLEPQVLTNQGYELDRGARAQR